MATHGVRNQRIFRGAVLTMCGILTAGTAFGSAIEPSFDTFGELSEATFGGSGIPNDAVAISTLDDGSNVITLGLSAHGRFSNPDVTNNGAGTFFAHPGANFGGSGESSTLGALWNVNFFIDVDGGGTFDDYTFELLYDLDAGAGTDAADHGVVNFNDAITALGGDPSAFTRSEGSENMLFSFLNPPDVPGDGIVPPSSTFDPNASGEYTFELRAYDGSGALLTTASMEVLVPVVPEPATMTLLGLGLGGLAVWRRRSMS